MIAAKLTAIKVGAAYTPVIWRPAERLKVA